MSSNVKVGAGLDMIIGIDTSALSVKSTGTSRYINCILEQLGETGLRVKAFSHTDVGSSSNEKVRTPFSKIKGSSFYKHFYRRFILSNEMLSKHVDSAMFPDYFISHNFNKPSVIIIHDLSFLSHPRFYSKHFVKFYTHQLKQTLKADPIIATVSEFSREEINKYLGIPKENIFLLQGYFAPSKTKSMIKTNKINITHPFFLYVGHIEPRKNIPFLIDTFLRWKRIHGGSYKLVIAGELWITSKEIKDMFLRYKDEPGIIFTGYVEEDTLDWLYSNAAAFVHASYVEGFGFPVLEAMNYGLPVICSKNTATEEISSPLSITIDPYDETSLLDGMNRAAEAIVGNGRIDYEITYTPERMKHQLENILNVLESRIWSERSVAIPKAVSTEEAVEKTLLYSKLFNCGMNKGSLPAALFDVPAGQNELDRVMLKLIHEGKIILVNDKLFINFRQTDFYRSVSGRIHKKKLKRSLKFLRQLPFITSIAFSGGTANYGIDSHEDLDLFIITKPYTVYIVYALIHFYSLLFKCRELLCANYLIDEFELLINNSRDLFTAHQIISLVPFKGEEGLNQFRNHNGWVKEFFPNFSIPCSEEIQSKKAYALLKPINSLLMRLYSSRYRNELAEAGRTGSLKLTNHTIKLHTHDYKEKVLTALADVLREYKSDIKYNTPAEIKIAG